MILVTVGTQLPFDRMIRAIDEIAPRLPTKVFAQIGRSKYQPQNCEYAESVPPMEFDKLLSESSLIVAHAGIGSVLMAQKMDKPLVIMPRRVAMGEHRNDHQMATARALEGRAGIHVVLDEHSLQQRLLAGDALSLPTQDCAGPAMLMDALDGYFRHGRLNAKSDLA